MKIFTTIIICIFVLNLHAQNVGIGTTTPDVSAQLDINSISRGVLVPRMTQEQRNAIASPATGLLIFQTDYTAGFYYYTGAAWTAIAGSGSLTGWSTTGNAGTDSLVHFVGTTDLKPLVFKVNNHRAGFVGNNGNIFWGKGAGSGMPKGQGSIAIGSGALYYYTGDSSLVAIGDSVLFHNGQGASDPWESSGNSAIGTKALYANTTGYNNTANGYQSLYSNRRGYDNTATGNQSLYSNDEGYNNTATGTSSLYSNTWGRDNTAMGKQSLYSNEDGFENTASGYQSLYYNESGFQNTANGAWSLYSNTVGTDNTANGAWSLYSNTSGERNTTSGYQSLYSNIDGWDNSANGVWSLFSNTTGSNNTANGFYSLHSNTTGNYNTAVGYNALQYNQTGNYNIAIGSNSGTWSNYTAYENTISIGNHGWANGGSNQVLIGNASTVYIGGYKPWSVYSDARMKSDIKDDVKGIDFIMKLRPVSYYQRVDDMLAVTGNKRTMDFAGADDANHIRMNGFLAQEVEQAALETGYSFSGIHKVKSAEEAYSLSYETFVVPLVKAVQEQQELIRALQQEVKQLKEWLQK